jgi:hypothetical protein
MGFYKLINKCDVIKIHIKNDKIELLIKGALGGIYKKYRISKKDVL